MAMNFTKDNFETEVLKSSEPVIIDFWAPWCGPCKAMGPIIDSLSNEAQGFKVGKVNVDDEPALAEKYNVASIPTVIVVKNGEVAARNVGLTTKENLLNLLK